MNVTLKLSCLTIARWTTLRSIYIGKKILLANQKIFRILPVLFLILSIFGNNVTARVCFCGEACLHSLQNTAKTRSNCPFHHRCLGTHCKSCNFEDSQTLQAKNSSTSTCNLDILDTPLIILFSSDYHSDNDAITIFYPQNDAFLKFQSSTIYILNSSLLIWPLLKRVFLNPPIQYFWAQTLLRTWEKCSLDTRNYINCNSCNTSPERRLYE